MTTPRHPLHVVPEPGGPSATTSLRAGSTNHQDHTSDEHATTPGHPGGIYELIDDTDPAELPTWLHQALTDQERPAMNRTDGTTTYSGNEGDERREPVLLTWLRRVFIEQWNPLVCAVVGLMLDVIVVLVVVHYVRNGVIPTWLDTHGGHWTWLGAGAFAAMLAGEMLDNVCRLFWAGREALDRRRMRVVADRLAAAGLNSPSGESTGGEQR